MGEEITAKTKVLTVNLTVNRKIYDKLTPIKELPSEVQERAKARGFIDEYGKVFVPQTSIDHKKRADKLERANTSLRSVIAEKDKQIAKLKKIVDAQSKTETDKDK
jgi:hypothetical protein